MCSPLKCVNLCFVVMLLSLPSQWCAEWDENDFVARSPAGQSIADYFPAQWVGCVTDQVCCGHANSSIVLHTTQCQHDRLVFGSHYLQPHVTPAALSSFFCFGFRWSHVLHARRFVSDLATHTDACTLQ
jgi:hypothetical protein